MRMSDKSIMWVHGMSHGLTARAASLAPANRKTDLQVDANGLKRQLKAHRCFRCILGKAWLVEPMCAVSGRSHAVTIRSG